MKLNSIFLCLLFALFANFITPAAKAQVNVNDSLALVDLYNNTNGPNWYIHTNWLTANPVSTWFGITVTGSRVVKIKLRINNLIGTLPASIGNLTNLTYLYLYYNQLSGSIPAEIGNLTNLTYVELGTNQLSGTIPASIGNLTKLTNLYLYRNQLTDPIPSALSNLTQLTTLDLSENQFSGTIPSTLGNLIKLTHFYLTSNQFTGTIPLSFGNLKNIIELQLSNNQLSGTIPDTIGNLININYLNLSNNQLTGTIPSKLSNLVNLIYLSLDHNQLSGAIPASLDKLKKCYSSFDYNKLSQFGDFHSSKDTNYQASCSITHNLFTFYQLQAVAKYFYAYYYYAPQDTILPIHQNGNVLSVSAGGSLSKNTYTWYKAGDAGKTVIKKDSTFSPAQSGMYFAQVRNSMVKELVLYSDTISFTMPLAQTENSIANVAAVKTFNNHFSVYPNPAKDLIHIQINGNAIITLISSAGKVLLTKTINNSDAINISGYANGIYYMQNKTTGETQKIVVVH